MAKRLLILEDGTIFEGQAFGADVDVTGEIVFKTGMTGYQESITDQSYNGQILTFTYPLVGNYGGNRDDYESIKPTTKGVVVSEASRRASNWRNQMTLDEFLKAKNIPGISGIDTRALTKIIRQHGTMKATLANPGDSIEHLQDQLRATFSLVCCRSCDWGPHPLPDRPVGKWEVAVEWGKKTPLRLLA